MFLIFDTETTGLPRNKTAPLTDFDNWPRIVQIAWQLHDTNGQLVEAKNHYIKPAGFTIPYNAEKQHGISTQLAEKYGSDLQIVLEDFSAAVEKSTIITGHNLEFDINITGAEYLRCGFKNILKGKHIVDTMIESTEFCKLPGGRGGDKYKYPRLEELHTILFGENFEDAHNAIADVIATARCFLELVRIGVINSEKIAMEKEVVENFRRNNPEKVTPIVLSFKSNKILSAQLAAEVTDSHSTGFVSETVEAPKIPFAHLHVHSFYSVLNATPSLKGLIKSAVKYNMEALALTDTGNLFGAYRFLKAAKDAKIKAIIGCELIFTKNRLKLKFTKDDPDRRTYQLFLAKNLTGYRNLSKLSSLGYLEGNYGGIPRIDKEALVAHKEGLITTTGGIYSEVNDLILNYGEQQAEEAFLWWKEQFGDDFYVQLNRHDLEEERRTNQVLIELARKHHVKIITANDVYYLDKEDFDLHDSLICIRENEYQATPKGRGRGFRIGSPGNQYYFKSQEEMQQLFADIPEALENISEIVEKVETYSLDQNPMMPEFSIPESFATIDEFSKIHTEESLKAEFDENENENNFDRLGGYQKVLQLKFESEYLRHLTYEGAKKRYKEITGSIKDRIDFELKVIKKMGYPGYFLIVWDFLSEARKMGVWVGPGRGSAAGSVVAYCLKITDIDPIEYDLLFERFLNPDRISLPDIDIDFDEDGRDKILKWVVEKYGHERVAHIITFGKMAPKMAIRDIARVKQLPLNEANRLAKLVPTKPGTTFQSAYKEAPELLKEKLESTDSLVVSTLKSAEKIEGTVRNIGTHACGIIISKDKLIEHIPLTTAKDANLLVTQFDGSHIENVGMLKMDFLGLKTLSIIKDTVENLKKSKNIEINIDDIPHDDAKTFELYSRGDTTGIFQFESDGMKKNLRQLKPNRFEDLIAMNALYRPGPIEYIPNYIRRKHGKEDVKYDIPEMEEYLRETYGITVYQEQVMRLSQKIGGFSRGSADTLRKAMGKKNASLIEELKPKFIQGSIERGHDKKIVEKVWRDWEEFANYAFNKSHSTCYTYVSYRMAYLKAHYPAEFMAAVLSRNLTDISKITFFIDETKRMGIEVLRPDVNESDQHFVVNKNGNIRFGMAAIKGLGASVAEAIIAERNANGPFQSVFDFVRRANLKIINKRSMEALARAGAFDSFENTHRAQFFFQENGDDSIFIEKLLRYATRYQEQVNSQQVSLFGETEEINDADPPMPECKPWTKFEQLVNEKEVTGFYISGHPLDDFKVELKNFCSHKISDFKDDLKKFDRRQITFGGMVVALTQRMTKDDKPWGIFTIEDLDDFIELRLYSDDYLKYKNFLTEGFFVIIHAHVQKRYKSENEFEVRIANVKLLADVLDRQTKRIKLGINLDDLNPDLIEEIFDYAKKFPGDCELGFHIKDNEEGIKLNFKSSIIKVQPRMFMKAVEVIPEIEYQLNGD
jgi:DNA polymerase III subunit alpha